MCNSFTYQHTRVIGHQLQEARHPDDAEARTGITHCLTPKGPDFTTDFDISSLARSRYHGRNWHLSKITARLTLRKRYTRECHCAASSSEQCEHLRTLASLALHMANTTDHAHHNPFTVVPPDQEAIPTARSTQDPRYVCLNRLADHSRPIVVRLKRPSRTSCPNRRHQPHPKTSIALSSRIKQREL